MIVVGRPVLIAATQVRAPRPVGDPPGSAGARRAPGAGTRARRPQGARRPGLAGVRQAETVRAQEPVAARARRAAHGPTAIGGPDPARLHTAGRAAARTAVRTGLVPGGMRAARPGAAVVGPGRPATRARPRVGAAGDHTRNAAQAERPATPAGVAAKAAAGPVTAAAATGAGTVAPGRPETGTTVAARGHPGAVPGPVRPGARAGRAADPARAGTRDAAPAPAITAPVTLAPAGQRTALAARHPERTAARRRYRRT